MNNRHSLSILLTTTLVFGGCGQPSNPKVAETSASSRLAELKTDTSTPEKALKSYWAVSDAARAHAHELDQAHKDDGAQAKEKLKMAVTQELYSWYVDRVDREMETFDRDIVKVEMETESRASIITKIRNTTPIPKGAKPDSIEDLERRNEGEPAKYIVEKDKDGWRVAEVWEWENYLKPGWKKMRPNTLTPSYPMYTYNGR